MKTPSQQVWTLHGAPVMDQCSPGSGRCYVCGGEIARGVPVRKWMSSNYTDQTKVRVPLAKHTCEACVFVMSRTSPVLGRPPKDGKKFGGNHRNYAHLWEQGWQSPAFADGGPAGLGYANATKGDKPVIRDFLARQHEGPWFAAIADSGQKHVIPYTPMNGRGRAGRVLFDEQLVFVPEDQSLLAAITDALTWGITKDEIASGDYRVMSWQRRPDIIRSFEAEHGRERASEWFTLAVWLGQRDEEEHARRTAEKETGDADRGGRRRDAGCVPVRAKRAPAAELLGTDRVADAGGGNYDGKRERVGGKHPAKPASAVAPRQLGLFDS